MKKYFLIESEIFLMLKLKALHKNSYNEIIRRRIYAYDSPLHSNALFTMRNGNKLRVYLNFNNFKRLCSQLFERWEISLRFSYCLTLFSLFSN